MSELNLQNICEGLINTFEVAGENSILLYEKGLEVKNKDDNSPVSNGDIRVNQILTEKIMQLTPNIPVISEETVNLKEKNKNKVFWLIDPIDGTKEYIAGKDEYTLNAALIIDQKPVIGIVGVPKKGRLFYSYGIGKSFLKEKDGIKKINCKKKRLKKRLKLCLALLSLQTLY